MKRASFLHIAGVATSSWKPMKQRDQLPALSVQADTEAKRGNYSLNDAFLLRALFDFIGGEDGKELAAAGIGPALASSILSNILAHANGEGVDVTAPGTFGAVVILEQTDADGSSLRFTRWFCNTLATFPTWMALTEQREGATAVRVIMINTARAAAFVRQRALEMNLAEAGDVITGIEG